MDTLTLRTSNGRPTAIELPRFRLKVSDGPGEGTDTIFEVTRVRMGSSTASDLVVNDPAASRDHCEIEVTEDGFLLRDLGSKNGTRVNGLRAREVFLPSGARLTVGESTVEFSSLDERVTIPLFDGDQIGPLLGRSLRMRQVMHVIDKVAPKDTTVLLIGETGTGKEVVARALHQEGPRNAKPFIAVDCGALQESLIDSELFGHVDGAFTGASSDRSSVFEDAQGGTVFLDEIGELPLALQSKLLRVLEARQIKRVGENTPRAVDFRLVAATNRRLADEVEDGNFRKDLYFRLSVVEIELPPLRNRTDDIPLLAEAFLRDLCPTNASPMSLSSGALRALGRHSWPGNVRELRNLIERAYALADAGQQELDEDGLLFASINAGVPDGGASADVPYALAQKQFERAYLIDLLERAQHNIPYAAQMMGVQRQSLYRMLKRHGIEP